jgi:glycosyltransferase 2 family protein
VTINKGLAKKILFPLLAVILLYSAFTKIDVNKLIETLKHANYIWVVVAFLAGICSHLVRALRWKMLVDSMGYNVRVRTGFYAVMTGYLVNIVTPRVGEVARCAMYHETDDVPVNKLFGTVVTERIFDLIVTILITLAVIWFQIDLVGEVINDLFIENDGSSRVIKLIIVGGLSLFLLAGYLIVRKIRAPGNQPAWVKKVLDFANGLLDGAKSIFKIKRPFLFLIYTILIWFLYFLMSYVIFFALGATEHLGIDAALTTLIMGTIAIIIPAPGGFGSFHYFVPLGLKLFDIDQDTGFAYAALSHTTQMVMIAIVGGISMILAGRERKKKAAL